MIHGGPEIDERLAGELLEVVSDWAATAGLGVIRVVEAGARQGWPVRYL